MTAIERLALAETQHVDQEGQITKPGKSDWDLLCETGRLAGQQLDEGRWILGDVALTVQKAYGHDRIAEFAKEAKVPVDRVREYRTVCKFYEISARADFLRAYPTLTYSHLRDAMRLGEADSAYAFLKEMAGISASVEEARIRLQELLGKPTPEPKLVLNKYCRIAGTIGQNGIIFEFSDPDVLKKLAALWHAGVVGLVMTLDKEG